MNKLQNVSRETMARLELYVETLLKWNRKINLIGQKTEELVWERHIDDCWRLQEHIPKASSIVDLGSGAGLPGLLFSIGNYEDVTLIESDLKKTAFLKYISGLLFLNTKIIEDRIEKHLDIQYDCLTARAFASLKDILPLAYRLLKKNGKAFLLKGEKIYEEIDEAQEKYNFSFDIIDGNTKNFGPILILSLIEPKAG